MNKKVLIIAAVIIAAAALGWYFWSGYYKAGYFKEAQDETTETADSAAQALEDVTGNVLQGVLPDVSTQNPLEEVPDLNPNQKSNPFKDIKTNPFD